MKKIVFLLLVLSIAFVSCVTLQERAERKVLMKKAVAEAVAKRQLHIDITSMNTMR